MELSRALCEAQTKLHRMGGVRGFLYKLMTTKDYRAGTLVGTDANGNKYYEDPGYMFLRDRYVEYSDPQNPDPESITPDWHRWIHHTTDIPPTVKPVHKPFWVRDSEPGDKSAMERTPKHVPLKEFHAKYGKIEPWEEEKKAPHSEGLQL